MSILKVIMETTKRDEFVQLFIQLHDVGQLDAVLERLEAYAKTLDLKHVKQLVISIFDIDDLIEFGAGGIFAASTDKSALRLIHHSMLREEDQRKRSEAMVQCLMQCQGVWLPVRFVSLHEPKDEEEDSENNFFDAVGLARAKEICLSKMRESNLEGINGQKLASCLFRWRNWAGNDEPRQWCEGQIGDIAGALRIVRACIRTSHVAEGSRTYVKKIVSLNDLEIFIDVDRVKSVLEPILVAEPVGYENVIEKYREEVEAFKKALKRRAGGKPDDWHFDED